MDVRKIFTQYEEVCQKPQPFLPSKKATMQYARGASISGKNLGPHSLQSIGLAVHGLGHTGGYGAYTCI